MSNTLIYLYNFYNMITYARTSYTKAESLIDPKGERAEKMFSTAAKRFFGTYKVETVKVNGVIEAIRVHNKAENFISGRGTYTDRQVYYFLDDRSCAFSEAEFITNIK